MLLIKLAWRNIIRHYKKSLLLGSLILVGMAVLFLANSVFQGTNDGLRRTLIGSFTGDAAIGAAGEGTYSLFGNEIPIVSDYDTVDPLYSHSQIEEEISRIPEVRAYTSIVSVPARLSIGNVKTNVALFGIDPDSYFTVCSDINIVSGDPSILRDSGVMLNSLIARDLERKLKRPLEIGEPLSFSMYSGNSFQIRSVPFAGIHKYSGSTEALDLVVLADLTTARSLIGYTLGYSQDNGEANEVVESDPFDLDSLFSVENDVENSGEDSFNLEQLENDLQDTEDRDALVLTDNGAWSFILIRAVDGESGKLLDQLESFLNSSDFDADLLNWRQAAGSSALILFAVQSLFYIGLGFLGLGAILVIMNALVFSVLERAGEIGTMRSMGASSGFIRVLFMLESLIVTFSGAIAGISLGVVFSIMLKNSQYKLSNDLLISMFGGTSLNPQISVEGILMHLLIALIIGALAWIYPVSLAIKIQPASAMRKE